MRTFCDELPLYGRLRPMPGVDPDLPVAADRNREDKKYGSSLMYARRRPAESRVCKR